MRITKIEQQKKNKKRYSVFIDNEFKFGMIGEDVLFFKLKEGMEIDEKKYEYILENVILTEAKDKAIRFLGYRPRTKKEMYNKLCTYEYPENVIESVMALLEQYGYINDFHYAETYIKEKTGLKNEGLYKIKYDLKYKGISQDLIERALAEFSYNPLNSILKLINKKLTLNNYDEKDKQKVYNYLVRKGFSHEDIKEGFRLFKEGYEEI